MKIEFRKTKYAWVVRANHEHVGSIITYASGPHPHFSPTLALEDNFSPPQYAEIKKAVAEKIALLNLTRRMLA